MPVAKTSQKISEAKIEKIKNDILGKKYSLSVAYVSEAISRKLNKKYRKKDKATNVLSFALRENMGELVLCGRVVQKEAKKLGKTPPAWLGFLLIHGMLHLKGHEHSVTMEKAEEKYDKKYFGGDRRGVPDDTGRGGRTDKRRKKS
jgi:probable rRNA maturation factor